MRYTIIVRRGESPAKVVQDLMCGFEGSPYTVGPVPDRDSVGYGMSMFEITFETGEICDFEERLGDSLDVCGWETESVR